MTAHDDGAALPQEGGVEARREEASSAPSAPFVPPRFEQVYDEHIDYLWRAARGMGVSPSAVDDVLQDLFLVVHRRLPEFEGRASVRTWLTRILVRVVSEHRRRFRRKESGHDELVEDALDTHQPTPADEAARNQAVALLSEILGTMDEDQRVVFVLAEIEQLPVPEIAASLEVNVNTVYSRLRLARKDYEKHLARLRAKDEWRQR
ncbi:MAG: RNA polymerase sigma factor [Sandaracinaceae bacterium]|nr:RNA polymerase sigma factor [Sandaracinaceae bacterium]